MAQLHFYKKFPRLIILLFFNSEKRNNRGKVGENQNRSFYHFSDNLTLFQLEKIKKKLKKIELKIE